MTGPLLTIDDVAKLLQCEPGTVAEHARLGSLPAVKFGKGWVFPTAALLQAINQMAVTEAQRRAKPSKPAAVQQRPARPNLAILAGANFAAPSKRP